MAQRNSSRKRQQKSESFMDYSLLFIVLFLLGFGMVMVFSTSSYEANLDYGDSTHYLKRLTFCDHSGSYCDDRGIEYTISFLGKVCGACLYCFGSIDLVDHPFWA